MEKKTYESPKFIELGASEELTLGNRDGDCLETFGPYNFGRCGF